jgi:hypothetical protein
MVDDIGKWLATFIVAVLLLYILFTVLIKRGRERQRLVSLPTQKIDVE